VARYVAVDGLARTARLEGRAEAGIEQVGAAFCGP